MIYQITPSTVFFHKGKDEFLGRCVAQPMVKLRGSKPPAPRLLWYPIMCGDKATGELLAAFELFLVRLHVFHLSLQPLEISRNSILAYSHGVIRLFIFNRAITLSSAGTMVKVIARAYSQAPEQLATMVQFPPEHLCLYIS